MTQPTIDTTQTLLVGIEMRLPPQSRELKQIATQAEAKAHAAAGTTRASLHYWRWEETSSTTFSKGKNKGQTKTALVKRDGLETLKTFQSSYKNALEHYARFPFATGATLLPAALAEPFFKTKEQYEKQLPEVWKK